MTAFDPAAWLAAFTAAGGTYAVGPDGALWLGTFDIGSNIEAHTQHVVSYPERVEAIKVLVRARCLMA